MEGTNSIPRNIIVETQSGLNSQGQKETKSKTISTFWKKNKIVILIIFLALFIGFLFVILGYFLGKNSMLDKIIPKSIQETLFKDVVDNINPDSEVMEGKEELKKKSTICDKESKEILSVVDKFEKLQKERKSSEIFDLFTDAKTNEEKEEYNKLKDKDGLYVGASLNYKTESYRVTSGPLELDGKCIVNVEERRSYPDGDNSEKYQEPLGRSFVLEFKKVSGKKWVINQYQSFEANVKKTKYSGFSMEVMK